MNETLNVIKYLLNEIEDTVKKIDTYKQSKIEAEKKADEYNKTMKPNEWIKSYLDFIDVTEPPKSLINDNAKKIRQLCLKLYE